MLIQHSNRSTAGLSHAGETYDSVGNGVFDVPDDVAHELIAFPHWEAFHGEYPGSAEAAAIADDGGTDWTERGRQAAGADEERAVPAGLHPRSRDARNFLSGYDSVKRSAATPPSTEPAPAQ